MASDTWRYLLGTAAPPLNWNTPGYDDSAWPTGPGGIGNADGDDATTIPTVASVFLRIPFDVPDTALFRSAVLHADYDDAFVAYLNGVEMSRANIGTPGIPPAFSDFADAPREAQMYSGGLPEAYYWTRSAFKSAVQPGQNILAIQVHNRSLSSSDMSALFFLSLASTDSVGLFPAPPAWFEAPVIASQLPLLLVETGGTSIPDEPKLDVVLKVADAGPGQWNFFDGPYDAFSGGAGIEIRGASSFFFAKQGYGLEIRDASGEGLALPLLGMPAEDDWILHGPYSDKSLLRNALAMHIAAQIDPWAPRFRFCELFIDGDYRGIYLLMERIERDDNRVDIARLDSTDISGDAVSGGYIVKIDRPKSEPFEGWYSPYWPVNHFIEFHDPKPTELQPEQRAFIRGYVTAFEEALQSPDFKDPDIGYTQFANRRSFAGHFIVQELANNVDAYRLSTFLYKDRTSQGGRLHAGPAWDFNLGFGNVDYCGANLSTTEWAYEADDFCGAPQPFWWDRLMLDDAFRNTLRCRWDSLRAGPLSTPSLMGFVDSLQLLLEPAAERNFTRWPVLGSYLWPNAFVGETWQEELAFLKDWLDARLYWMDLAMPGYCVPLPSGLGASTAPAVRVYPSICTERLMLESGTNQVLEWTLYSLTGQSLGRVELSARATLIWELPTHLADGSYLWSCQNRQGQIVERGMVVCKR